MKELSIEEKARRYDEALKEAIIAHKDEDRHLKATLERIFPELAKSKDEMIRKALMDFLVGKRIISNDLEGINIDKTLAWLERQGEQKPNCSEEAMKYLKENHSPSEVSDFQAAMNIAVAKAYDKGKADAITKMQNYAWSDEDEKFFKTALRNIGYSVSNGKSTDDHCDITDWLKTLKNRIQMKLKQTWIKEDNENNRDLASSKKIYEKMIRIANFYRSIEGETDLRTFGIDFNNLDDSENYKKDGKLINQDFAFSHPETRDAFYKNFKQDLLKIKNYIK